MDGLSALINQLVAVSSVIGNLASVLGFITLLATLIGYFIKKTVVDPFGPKAPRGPRYRKFFESMALRVNKRDKSLSPPDSISEGPVCDFSTENYGVTYALHFVGQGDHKREFCLYIKSDKLSAALSQDKARCEDNFRKHARDKKATLDCSGPQGHLAIYFPDKVGIEDDVKKLKRVRKWAVRRLLALKRTVDELEKAPALARVQANTAVKEQAAAAPEAGDSPRAALSQF